MVYQAELQQPAAQQSWDSITTPNNTTVAAAITAAWETSGQFCNSKYTDIVFIGDTE